MSRDCIVFYIQVWEVTGKRIAVCRNAAWRARFVPAGSQNTTGSMVVLAGVFMAMTFIVFVMYGALASLARDYVISRPVGLLWMRRIFAGTFCVLGLRLAFGDKH